MGGERCLCVGRVGDCEVLFKGRDVERRGKAGRWSVVCMGDKYTVETFDLAEGSRPWCRAQACNSCWTRHTNAMRTFLATSDLETSLRQWPATRMRTKTIEKSRIFGTLESARQGTNKLSPVACPEEIAPESAVVHTRLWNSGPISGGCLDVDLR